MRRLTGSALLALVLLVGGCAAESAAPPTSDATAAPPTSASPTPTPTPTPTPDPVLVVSLDGLDAGAVGSASLADGTAVVALLSLITGEVPAGLEVPACPEGYDCPPNTRYDFPGMRVWVQSYDGSARVSIDAPLVGGLAAQTPEGVAVGMSRAEALALGARETGYPEQFPHLAIGDREVPGTRSYSRDGATGVDYQLLVMTGDTVSQITPGNDYSDL